MRLKLSILIPSLFLIAAAALADNYTYIQGPALIESSNVIATSASTTTLTATSDTNQDFTGSSIQTAVLPDATKLQNDRVFRFLNLSTGLLTVQDATNVTQATVYSGNFAFARLRSNATTAGVWSIYDPQTVPPLTAGLPVFGSGTGITTGTASGNTTEVATVASAFIAGDAVTSDASGNLIDAGTPPGQQIPVNNSAVPGTTLRALVGITAGVASNITAGSLNGAAGIVVSGAGTAGQAIVAQGGVVACNFDGAVTFGDFVGISSGTNGDCTDIGGTWPTANYEQAIGMVVGIRVGGHAPVLLYPGMDGFHTAYPLPYPGSNGQVVTATGSGFVLSTPISLLGSQGSMSFFNTSGSHTFTTPARTSTSTIYQYMVLGDGGGGGGSSAAFASGLPGGAGGEGFGVFTGVAPGTNITITIGAGGSAGTTAPTNGGNGTGSSIGVPVSCSCGGGNGGTSSTAGAPVPGAGGACAGCNLNITGGTASPNIGASSQWGMGGSNNPGAAACSVVAGTGYGSGGGGGSNASTSCAGQPGALGLVIIWQVTP